ncbi:LacI family DNA-binding transcriptional regulator [Aquiflexum gelatinilyticum]|uniref:LacI family transcriptional regulator n=1 Tax=Aquiflexum gelatinilyticum TaxID=2961943 RepID=A0A9X2P6S1_9BACT|nr:LacI family DNA-binding transcriptional regulator [Aquiflexum gelatinilyticum]MCR9015871.1 LacI family transcriptional regulator [Aquiflexum gelatinilyticum]MCS4436329.1 LacI family transcriptional regulator [Aquiflexum gelatinilyticum]
MKSGQATIKDIARELNVSTSTVSRALKDYPGISDETKRKVKELADKLHYRPNAVALSLRKSKSFTIGVIIPEVVHFFFSTVISGVEEVAFANGYNVILCQTNEKFSRERSSVETMLSNQIDGVLVSFSRETTNFDHFKKMIDREFPIVFFDRIPDLENTINVTVNDYQGAYNAVKHLIDQGFKKIVHLSGPDNLAISKQRKEGYLDALKDSGIVAKPEWILECPYGTEKESISITTALFKNNENRPDAIFAHHDIVAAGAMMALKSLGLKIPEDVGVVGFSNWQFSSMIDPPLSTVSQPGFQIGETATKILLDLIHKKTNMESISQNIVLDTELLIRKSSVKV